MAALTGNPLRVPELSDSTSATAADSLVSIRLDAADLCPRYVARVVRGVKIGPSPDWLRSALEKIGIRSINNVVDATNYVMMECGQPLHAFDYHLIAKDASGQPAIVVRRARDGEDFVTLDGQKHKLSPENLLIADEQKAIALAGVMGGQNTEINDRTVDVLIESAWFLPSNIRRTSKSLGLRTDASYRFERGADIGNTDWAATRCANLIVQTAGGELARGLVDAYPQPAAPKEIPLRHHKVNDLLGLNLKPEEIEYYLGQLGLKIAARKARPVGADAAPEPAVFRIPTFRVDLKREVDLIEEVARLHGVDKIPSTPPRGAIGSNAFDAIHDQVGEARRILCGLGLNEAQGQTLVGKAECRATAEPVALANPLSADMDVLRPSLLPGLLAILRHNVSRKNPDLSLFEIGKVFAPAPAEAAQRGCIEERRVALALTGLRQPLFWSGAERDAKFDLSDLKGVLEEFLEHYGVRGLVFTRRADSTPLFLESATLQIGKLPLGEMGLLLPSLARQYDLRDPVCLAELSLDQLLARRNPAHHLKPLPGFPSVRRDIALVVAESTTHDAVLQVVRQTKPANLESVELFDVFRGRHVPEGQKSMAYAFIYRAPDKTLTDAEVNAAHAKLVESFQSKLKASLRE
ncbi:MAG: phenylalanine--tRNA ligase subunit beta [Verrucomicrobiota bacterium]